MEREGSDGERGRKVVEREVSGGEGEVVEREGGRW